MNYELQITLYQFSKEIVLDLKLRFPYILALKYLKKG